MKMLGWIFSNDNSGDCDHREMFFFIAVSTGKISNISFLNNSTSPFKVSIKAMEAAMTKHFGLRW